MILCGEKIYLRPYLLGFDTDARSENKESESSSLFPRHAPVAQSVEQLAFNEKVAGSKPAGRTWKLLSESSV